MIELFDQGAELRDIADQLGCSVGLVSIAVIESGRSAFLRHYPQSKGRDNAAVLEDYQSGMPLDEISKKHGLDQSRIAQLRKEAGMETRERPHLRGEKNGQYKHGMAKEKRGRNTIVAKQVAAICLGHIVPNRWHIHHMDEDPSNNQPENLVMFPSNSTHMKYHQLLLKSQHEDLEVDAIQLALENGGIPLPIPNHPIVLPHEKGRLGPRKTKEKPKQGQE